MLKRAIAVLHVTSSRRAEEFYCGKLGFSLQFTLRPFGGDDPCYMGFLRDNAYFHASSFSGDGVKGGIVFIEVDDVDALFVEFQAKGLPFDPEPVNQSWGNREMYTTDEDGNSIRFFCPLPE